MPSAKVQSIDALKEFRAALIKFAAEVRGALDAGESDISRTTMWLNGEAKSHWKNRLYKAQDQLNQARGALRQKKLMKNADGSEQSVVEEEMQVKQCQRRVEHAEEKLSNVQRWQRAMDKEVVMYKGQAQSVGTLADADIPRATARLDRMIMALEQYLQQKFELPKNLAEAEAAIFGAGRMGGGESDADQAPDHPYRQLTPANQVRDDTELTDGGPTGGAGDAINQDDQAALAELSPSKTPAPPDAKVVLAKGALGEKRVYLERVSTSAAGDSGWFIGPADAEPDDLSEFEAVTVADLLSKRPDLAGVLEYPQGWLAVLKRGDAEAVFDGNGNDAWAAANEPDENE